MRPPKPDGLKPKLRPHLKRSRCIPGLEQVQKDPELSAALSSIDTRESECLTTLEKAFRNRIAIPLPGMCSK
jgi:hypothetical protein